MAAHSLIEWCTHTANLWWGCSEVHLGCDHCYARTFARAKGKASAWDGVRFATKSIWRELLKWQREAMLAGETHRVFCGSMMDIFEKPMPVHDWQGNPTTLTTGDLRDRLFREIVPATPDLLYLLLTKRPGNATKYVPAEWLQSGGWPGNVMVGASVSDQETADVLVSQLARVPGPTYLSVEPLLGAIDLTQLVNGRGETYNALTAEVTTHRDHTFRTSDTRPIDWVIVGGESGPGARPFHVMHGVDLMGQCADAGVPFFWKQMGSHVIDRHGERIRLKDSKGGDWAEWPEDFRVREFPTPTPAPESAS